MRQLSNSLPEFRLRIRMARRPMEPNVAAGLLGAHHVSARQVLHDFARPDGLPNFFCRTSCSIALSGERSATMRLSFAFSSRSWQLFRFRGLHGPVDFLP